MECVGCRHVSLETRSRCSTKMWRISVADGDIGKIPKATNRKSGSPIGWPQMKYSAEALEVSDDDDDEG